MQRIQRLTIAAFMCCSVQIAAESLKQPPPLSFYDRVMARLFPAPDPSETSYTLQYLHGASEMQITFSDAPSFLR